ncbi:MAG: hypothetical protein Q4E68_03660 [Prevotellaceae bacterium]|nr:hypothetical protein [Prevotellaceae bacterium]
MKKNVMKTMLAAVCVVAAGMGSFKAYNAAAQSETDMLLAENVEALSETESGGKNTKTSKTPKTTTDSSKSQKNIYGWFTKTIKDESKTKVGGSVTVGKDKNGKGKGKNVASLFGINVSVDASYEHTHTESYNCNECCGGDQIDSCDKVPTPRC